MKILIFVSYAYPFLHSGLGNVASKQAEELASRGHEVHIISSNHPRYKKKFSRNGVQYYKLEILNFLFEIGIPVPIPVPDPEVNHIAKDADIIHAHDAIYPTSLLGMIVSRKNGKPFVLTQHVGFVDFGNPITNTLEKVTYETMGRLIWASCNKVLVCNRTVGKWLHKFIRHNNIEFIRNGVDIHFFKPPREEEKREIRKLLSLPLERKIIMYVGHLYYKKGYDVLLEFTRRASKSLFFIFVTDTPEKVANSCKNLRVFSNVSLTELSDLYKASDLFVLPSRGGEGFPLTILEALASGLPVIVGKVEGYRDYLEDAHARFVEPEVEDLEDAIYDVIDDDATYYSMSSSAREAAVSKHSWENNVARLLEIYQSLGEAK